MAQQDLIFHIANKVQDVVWVSDRRFLALKELLVNIFTTFMWDSLYAQFKNQNVLLIQLTLIFYVGSSSQLTHMFQCVKKEPANMHRELSKKGYVWMVLEEN